ncbi:hypothetical protein Avbf_12480 [Armadillidium vulgare]|nr:hypothetical protein Avbf_12480 [Armadillidium vulgare]
MSYRTNDIQRDKRGLIDGVFGTAVDSDVQVLERSIQILVDRDDVYSTALTQLKEQLKDTVAGINNALVHQQEIIGKKRNQ